MSAKELRNFIQVPDIGALTIWPAARPLSSMQTALDLHAIYTMPAYRTRQHPCSACEVSRECRRLCQNHGGKAGSRPHPSQRERSRPENGSRAFELLVRQDTGAVR